MEGRALPATARSVATGLSSGVTRNFAIELDTTAAQWTFKVLIDGVQQGATYTYAEGENPNLSYITVSSGFSGNSFVGTFDNFSFTLVPEPSGMVLAAFSAGVLFLRRRR